MYLFLKDIMFVFNLCKADLVPVYIANLMYFQQPSLKIHGSTVVLHSSSLKYQNSGSGVSCLIIGFKSIYRKKQILIRETQNCMMYA